MDGGGHPGAVWARRRVLALCVLLPVAELVALWAVGAAGDRALAAEVSAPAPLDVFHDLRWLLVLHDSWWALALEAAGIAVLRTLVDAAIVRAAWPAAGRVAPPWGAQLRRTAVFVAASLLVLLPWTVIGFGVDVVAISWLFFAAVPPVVVIAAAASHGAVHAGWWRRLPPARSVGWVSLAFLVETATGAAVGAAPAPLWVPLVALGGVFNAWAWSGVVAAASPLGERRGRFLPVAPAVSIGMLAVAVLGAALSFQLVGTPTHVSVAPRRAAAAGDGSGPPVLLVGGFGSALAGALPHPVPGPWDEVRYSYAGSGPGGAPEPYGPADTHQGLDVSVRRMATQVAALAAATHARVALVAESEGSLIARTYLAAYPGAPVSRVVLLSPLDQPGRVYYPSPGHQGYGVLTGYALSVLTSLLGGFSPVDLPADSPFLRSIVDHASELRDLLDCPTRPPEALLEPLADAVVDPVPPGRRVPAVVVPAFHGGLLTDRRAQLDVATLLAGGTVAADRGLLAAERAVRLAAGPWQVPSLPIGLDAGPGGLSCAAMAADIGSWVRPGLR